MVQIFFLFLSLLVMSCTENFSESKNDKKNKANKSTLNQTKTQSVQFNELGLVPVLAYHKVGDEDTEYTRSRSGFREDMLQLIRGNFHPISLDEFKSGNILAPAGKIPVLLTFDDSSISQFEMRPNGSIAPDCVMGILEDLRKKNKDFHPKAVFFVLPGAKSPNNYFGQNEFQQAKTDFLLKNGYAIENHTYWHANLKQYSKLIEEQIAKTQDFVQKLAPGYKMSALALPFGIYPPESERHRLLAGSYKGIQYKHSLVFDFSNRLSYSPYSKDFDPLHVRRIHGNKVQMERFFKSISKPGVAFISDGDPGKISISRKQESQLHPKWKSRVVFVD
ncbi:MAG: polysaccharide deacetylase family protein [Leptospira sp.]|nr:polysaccharide deacetylase family protein [Leptospira sp.]